MHTIFVMFCASAMLLFVDLIATKRIIAPALNTRTGGPAKVFETSHGQMWDAIRALVKGAIKSGDIRKDLDAIDLLRAHLDHWLTASQINLSRR